MTEKRKPAKGRLLLRRITNEQKTAGGLIMAESFENPTQRTIILAHGECNQPFTIGHLAYIGKHGGIDIGGSHDEIIAVENEILYTEPAE